MRSLSGIGFGLSIVFGVLFLAFIAEAYYLICFRKKKTVYQLFNWKKSTVLPTTHHHRHRRRHNHPEKTVTNPDTKSINEQNPEVDLSKDFIYKAFGQDTVEAELMRLHNLAGPPRFLFTIKEETMDDLESEDGKSIKGRSLSSPFFSPLLPSPPLKATLYGERGPLINPLFESTAEAEFNKFKSSPPPKFKFLRDAEEKLLRRLMEESKSSVVVDNNNSNSNNNNNIDVIREGSFLTFLVGKHRDVQILPLASSPATENSVVN
ncbi:hypothetical protein ACFE04_007841 [Oxalis oulophora]